MRILVLAPQWPDPPRQGAAIRNLQILLYLARRHRVTLLTFEPDGPIDKSHLESLCEHVEILPRPNRSRAQRLKTLLTSPLPDMAWRLHSELMRDRVPSLAHETPFDAVHVEGIEMAPYALLIQDPKSGCPLGDQNVYDAHNAEYLLQRRAFTTDLRQIPRWPRALYSLVQWWRLRRFERHICLLSDYVLSVSQNDAQALQRLAPRKQPIVLPNGVDPSYWSREAGFPAITLPEGPKLVFDGTMDFRPNVDAVVWFASQVWPAIRAEQPGARFYIVGRNPAREVEALASEPGITVTGPVDDTRSWVAQADVYVVPMRMGGGVRLKVLQAMSMGCAIVSTPMGAEGIDVRDGAEMLLARSPASFADATLSLLGDPALRRSLGDTARSTVSRRYAWDTLLPVLERIYKPNS